MLLVVDNGSVYTPSLLSCLKNIDIDFEHYAFSDIPSLDYSSIILSGRRKNDAAMNAVNSKLIKHCLQEQKPLLGICYGAEILALTLGGTIKKMTSPRHGLYEIDTKNDNPLCEGKIQVFESHSYMISKLNPKFMQLAVSTECNFEIFQYANENIYGTQFHPEMSDDGKVLLEKFTSIR